MSSFWALPPGWAQSPEGRSERKREPGGRSPFSSPPLRITSSQILTPPENDATCPQRGRSGGVRSRGDQREGLGHPGPGPNSSPGSEQEDLGLQQQQTRRLTEPDTAHIVQSHSTAGTVSTPILQIRRLSAEWEQLAHTAGEGAFLSVHSNLTARVRHFSTRFSHPFLPLLSRNPFPDIWRKLLRKG